MREEEGLAAIVLRSLGITVEQVRVQVVKIVGRGEDPTAGQIPFTPRAKKVLELALREALSPGHNYIGTEHTLLGLVRENEGVAIRILLDLNADAEKIRNAVIRMPSDRKRPIPAPEGGPRSTATARVEPRAEEPIWEGNLDLGWRGRSITLAALGAAVLARSAFSPDRTGRLEPLEMQLLAHLTLQTGSEPASEPGEDLKSLSGALACDPDEFRYAVHSLADEHLVVCPVGQDEDRVAITTAGAAKLKDWLPRTMSLFAGWPPDHPGIDDSTG